MLIRWFSITKEDHLAHWPLIKHVQFFAIRFLLIGEFLFAVYTGHTVMWIAQFILSLWYNLFLIVSSHDFEESETHADLTPG
jgi:hypothetical protein